MTEHNINEAAPLAALAPLAAKAGKAAGAAKAMGSAGKVANKAKGLLGGPTGGIEKTSGTVSEESAEQLDEFAGALLKGAIKQAPKLLKGKNAIKATGRGLGAAAPKMDAKWLTKGLRPSTPATKPHTPKIKPQPQPTPKHKPRPQPSPKTDPKPDPTNPPSKTPNKPKVKSPTDTPTGSGSKSGQGTKQGTGTGTGTQTNSNTQSQLQKAGATLAGGAVGAAALGTLKMMKKKKVDGLGDIGKTSGRVKVEPKQTEEQLEIVCDFLIDRGFASTGVEAENIYEHMSPEWKEYILNS